jgi:zinc transporter ZupT
MAAERNGIPVGCRSVLTSLPQAVVAVPAFMFVSTFRALLPLALGFAAGCMVWMVFAELLPDALENASHAKVYPRRFVFLKPT